MLKVCTLFKRKKGLSVEEYQSYWRGEHPELVKRLPGVRRYAQNHPLPDTFKPDPPIYDGVVELYFDDSSALKHLSTTQEYQDLNADEENFVDRSTIQLVFTHEHILKEGERKENVTKRITFFKRAPGMSPEEFQERWLAEYGDSVASSKDVIRYCACAPRLNGYRDGREPAWDGIDMATFASLAAARCDDYLGELEGLVSTLDLQRMYTRENRVID
ncbi:EthD domain-containing protein [Paraburkholderia xenovorans]|uniref:EthD domain-containing protein n=1 Tax=Paraburkholderia xenovorans TaxID=36873 RepID=UPI0038B84792